MLFSLKKISSQSGVPFSPPLVCISHSPPFSVHIHEVQCCCSACVCVMTEEGRERESSGKSKQTLSMAHGLHAQWRGDDVEPWRKCPHLRQSSCACPSRLAARDHPFKHSPAPCSSARLSPHILFLWDMGCDTRLDYLPLLSLVTVEAPLLMLWLSSDVMYKYTRKTHKQYAYMYILKAFMYMKNRNSGRTERRTSSFISHGLFHSIWETTKALTSSTKVTQVIGPSGATVDRQAGGWPRVR